MDCVVEAPARRHKPHQILGDALDQLVDYGVGRNAYRFGPVARARDPTISINSSAAGLFHVLRRKGNSTNVQPAHGISEIDAIIGDFLENITPIAAGDCSARNLPGSKTSSVEWAQPARKQDKLGRVGRCG